MKAIVKGIPRKGDAVKDISYQLWKVVTHVYKLEDFEKGLEIIKKGEGGKVILIP